MRKTRALIIALLATAPLAMGAPHALAAPTQAEMDRGVKLFAEAQELYDGGKHEEALELFREVDALLESPNARLYIARCLRELERLPEAFETMDEAAELARVKAASDARYLKTRDAAAAEREALAEKVGRVVVALDRQPEGLRILLGERALEPGELGRPLGVRPGPVTLTARAPGYAPFRRRLEVAAGELETVAVVLAPAEEPSTPVAPPEGEGASGLFIGGWTAVGIGAAGMVMFAVAGSLANARFSDIEEQCGGGPCSDPALVDDIEGGKTLDAVANAGAAIGAVGLVTGTVLLIVGWPGSEEPNETGLWLDVQPLRGAARGMVGYRLRF